MLARIMPEIAAPTAPRLSDHMTMMVVFASTVDDGAAVRRNGKTSCIFQQCQMSYTILIKLRNE